MQSCHADGAQMCLGSSACRLKVSVYMVPCLCRVQARIKPLLRHVVAMSRQSALQRGIQCTGLLAPCLPGLVDLQQITSENLLAPCHEMASCNEAQC